MNLNFGILNRIVIFLIKGLIFILPLFFLPSLFAAEGMDNFGKQWLVWLIVPLVLVLLAVKAIKQGEIVLARSPLYALMALYLIAAGLAAFLSPDRFSSFFGSLNNFYLPFFVLAAGPFLYFTVLNAIRKKEDVTDIIKALFAAYVLALAAFIFLFFSSWTGILDSASPLFFYFRLALGFLDDLALYAAFMNVLIFAFLWSRGQEGFLWGGKDRTFLFKILSFVSLWLLAQANSSAAWLCLAVGVIFALASRRWFFGKRLIPFFSKDRADKFWPAILIMIPLLFLFFNYLVVPGVNTAAVAERGQLDFKNTATVSLATLKSRPLFGYGPEMFSAAISLFRDQGLNNASAWDTRYRTGSSYIFILAATTGLAGISSYAVLMFLWFFRSRLDAKALKNIFKKDPAALPTGDANIFLAVSAASVALLVGQFVSAANTALFFLFWIFLALGTTIGSLFLSGGKKEAGGRGGDIKIIIRAGSFRFAVFTVLACLLFLGWAALVGKYAQYYLADINFRRADNGITAENERRFLRANELNPYNYSYKTGLARYYLASALNEISGNGNAELIRNNFNKSIDWARKAQAASPRNVAVYEVLGAIYRHIGVYSPEGYKEAIKAFKEAAALEPTNPVIISELGNIYLAQGDYENALAFFKQAAELKKDFFPSEIGLAKTYSAREEYDQALAILKGLETGANNLDVYFEEGRIYYNQGNLDEAIKNFRQLIALEPLHANGLYGLALALEKSGAFDEARFYYGMVLKLNPGNAEIGKKIEELKKP